MKPILVQKYGGSSIADVDKLSFVADQITKRTQEGYRMVVVVSAMGKTTDQLIELAGAISADPSQREMDMLVSAGERIAASLLAAALIERGVDAVSFTGSQCGIITSARHASARILEVRPFRVQDELDNDRVVVIAGYQGVSYKKEITTLGRGGSDITAIALTAALSASHCEIYSDFAGIYSADPKKIKKVKHIDKISYEEMAELAEGGAQVLNGEAVDCARRWGIVIHAKATQGGGEVTLIGTQSQDGLSAVAVTQNLTLVRADTRAAIISDQLADLPCYASFMLDGSYLSLVETEKIAANQREARLKDLENKGGQLTSDLAAVTVVGRHFDHEPKYVYKILKQLNGECQVVCYFFNPVKLTFVVPNTDVERSSQIIHQSFVEGGFRL